MTTWRCCSWLYYTARIITSYSIAADQTVIWLRTRSSQRQWNCSSFLPIRRQRSSLSGSRWFEMAASRTLSYHDRWKADTRHWITRGIGSLVLNCFVNLKSLCHLLTKICGWVLFILSRERKRSMRSKKHYLSSYYASTRLHLYKWNELVGNSTVKLRICPRMRESSEVI